MNLADPELELIDPTPNVHALFLQFDKIFFWTKLASRAVVRWSKRMYSCAGICSYDRGGLCDIALSEPLLKLRPRKDLIETLLHEMIHAYLFVSCQDQDRDGHGPNFKSHMHRINKSAGLNISVYHDFHDEVKLYQNHWWRCNGPCQYRKPYFGIVRRAMNRAPGPCDCWWRDHQRKCGGTFSKIKEPEKSQKPQKKKVQKPNVDISNYFNNNNNNITTQNNKSSKTVKPVLKDSNNIPSKSNSTLVVSKKNNIIFNPHVPKQRESETAVNTINRSDSTDVVETVRNVWANKTIPVLFKPVQLNTNNQKRNSNNIETDKHSPVSSPPKKLIKIDDYFKTKATSILKDLYGQDFSIEETKQNQKVVAVAISVDKNLVNCPVCNIKIKSDEVNTHLDECLNKEEINKLCIDNNKQGNINVNRINYESKDSLVKLNQLNTDKSVDLMNTMFKSPAMKEYPMTKIEINTKPILEGTELDNIEVGKHCKDTIQKISIETSLSESEQIKKIKSEQNCPCCGDSVDKTMGEHLDECLAFFDNNTTIPEEGASTSSASETILIDDDDDIHDETLTMNATGTKTPCPCCLKMIEMAVMNDHLDVCLLER